MTPHNPRVRLSEGSKPKPRSCENPFSHVVKPRSCENPFSHVVKPESLPAGRQNPNPAEVGGRDGNLAPVCVLHLSGRERPQRYIPEVLPWIHDAGNPFYDWFYGGGGETRHVLGEMMRRPSSEMWIGRVNLMTVQDEPVGGFIANPGQELSRCTTADVLALLKRAPASERAEAAERIKKALGVFPPVGADEYFLSSIGVRADCRRRGHGKRLVEAYLAQGRAAGYRRFRLNVQAENRPAVHLYESFGFEVTSEPMAAQGRMKYWAMTLTRHDDATA